MHPSKRTSRLAATLAATLFGMLPFAAKACNTEPYIGTICTFAFDWCPQGYVKADGRTLTIRDNQALFGLIGFTYGGDNQTNFKIPDLRGRVAVGTGTGTGLSAVAIAQQLGQQQVTLSPAQTPLPAHTHGATFTTTSAPVNLNIPATTGNLNVAANLPVSTSTGASASLSAGQTGYMSGVTVQTGAVSLPVKGPYTTSKPTSPGDATLPADVTITGAAGTAATTVSVNMVNGGVVTVQNNAPVAPTVAVPTQPPSIGMSACIAVTGLYPNRP